MNDERVNQIAEDAGSVIQRVAKSYIHNVYDKLKPTVKHKILKIVLIVLSKVTGVRLIVNSVKLNQRKCHAIAKVCYWIGTITLFTNLTIVCSIDIK